MARLNPRHTGQVVTIEKTGKGIKAQGCLAQLMLVAGIVFLGLAWQKAKGDPTVNNNALIIWGIVLLGFSLPWMLYIRIATWWRHG